MRGVIIGAALAAALVWPAAASAQQAVTGLTATQEYGFTTLRWNPVEGATSYEIERQPIDANDQPTGNAQIVGRWFPQRTITPNDPRFADSGYTLGGRYQWRVRVGTDSNTFSDYVRGTTMDHWGEGPGAGLRSGWEQRLISGQNATTYTTDVEERDYTQALDEGSERMRVVELARTRTSTANFPNGRPVNLLIFGYPKPPDTAQEISDSPSMVINCNVHGNEASGRESCFTMARQLAFSNEPAVIDVLSRMTILMVPSINADGRAANTRGNSTGQDLNRDHALIEQNETKGFAAMLRDYTPDVGLDNHEGDSEDLPILAARHRNVYEPLFEEGKFMVNEWMYGAAAQSGWWMGPYSTGGDSHEGILRNTASLKHAVSMLGEARAAAGNTRPAEGASNSVPNRIRKAYAHLWENWETVRYYAARMNQIRAVTAASEAAAVANVTGTTILRGSYPWPSVPSVGEGNNAPDVDTPLASRILTPAPCGYFIPMAEYTMDRPTSANASVSAGSVAQRLAIHGIKVEPAPGGVFVPLRQRLRGLIAPILDSQAVLPMLETAERRYCFREDGEVSGTVPATLSLELSAPANFGAFTPGEGKDYETSTTANVISSAGDATLSVADPDSTATGRLVNGAFSLEQPLQAKANAGSYAAVGGSANPTSLLTYDGPVSNDAVTLGFKQTIGANEALRTGSYGKTLTFTLSTTTP
ncbi:MAG TPA: M14 family zinc carboxypeptidase [Solirubrobacter sp.]|nr:M14 family zinc carboxypeptidase [Solirubrobacter sp.]